MPTPDPRYFEGIRLFNEGEYYEAHEVWESLWLEDGSDERRFYQGLIQAAVSCLHHERGNRTGAESLFHSATAKLLPYRPVCLGLDVDRFLADFAAWYAAAFGPADAGPATPHPTIHAEAIPPES